MNRVRAILLAHAGPPLNLLKARGPLRSRRAAWRDGLRFVVAILLTAGALAGVYASIAASPFMKVKIVDEAAELRRIEAEAQARRIGSILFLAPDRFCEEHSFDNKTGNTVAIQTIDCDARLAGRTTADTATRSVNMQSMQDMLASFKK
jgi:hypothetical protein